LAREICGKAMLGVDLDAQPRCAKRPQRPKGETMSATTAAVLLYWGYGLIGTYDSLYYHLYRFRLYERPESFREHVLHTVNIFLTAPVAAGLYVARTAGLTLWLATGFAAAHIIVAFRDILEEHDSRAQLGGLQRPEYVIHVVVCMIQAASVALVLADRPAAAWSVSAPTLLEPIDLDARAWSMIAFAAVALALGILHVALAWRGYQSIRTAPKAPSTAAVASIAAG
jgi:hypothetical protein